MESNKNYPLSVGQKVIVLTESGRQIGKVEWLEELGGKTFVALSHAAEVISEQWFPFEDLEDVKLSPFAGQALVRVDTITAVYCWPHDLPTVKE